MSNKYLLKSLNQKTAAVAKDLLAGSANGTVKAAMSTQYQLVDSQTGKSPKRQVVKKKGKDLVIEVDGEQVAVIQDFYAETPAQEAPTYRIDDTCSLDDANSLEASNKHSRRITVRAICSAAGSSPIWPVPSPT